MSSEYLRPRGAEGVGPFTTRWTGMPRSPSELRLAINVTAIIIVVVVVIIIIIQVARGFISFRWHDGHASPSSSHPSSTI